MGIFLSIFIWCLYIYPIFHLLGYIETKLTKLKTEDNKYKFNTGQIDTVLYFIGITLMFGVPSLLAFFITI